MRNKSDGDHGWFLKGFDQIYNFLSKIKTEKIINLSKNKKSDNLKLENLTLINIQDCEWMSKLSEKFGRQIKSTQAEIFYK